MYSAYLFCLNSSSLPIISRFEWFLHLSTKYSLSALRSGVETSASCTCSVLDRTTFYKRTAKCWPLVKIKGKLRANFFPPPLPTCSFRVPLFLLPSNFLWTGSTELSATGCPAILQDTDLLVGSHHHRWVLHPHGHPTFISRF